jgi:hypothetical protein
MSYANGDTPEVTERAGPTGARSFEACINLLTWIEELPADAVGALTFDSAGVILVERRRVCWALSDAMTFHLTDVLCRIATPPIERSAVEAVYRHCKEHGVPISTALLSSGLISEVGLRLALREHNREALLRLSETTAMPTRFRKLAEKSYDARFVFSTAELLASLGAAADERRAARADAELTRSLVPASVGCAFAFNDTTPIVVALSDRCDLPVTQLLEVSRWATAFMAAGSDVDPNATVCSATWSSSTAVVAWRRDDVGYVAFCATRVASALLLDKLLRRATPELPVQRGAVANGLASSANARSTGVEGRRS